MMRDDVVRIAAFRMAGRGMSFADATLVEALPGDARWMVADWREQGGCVWDRLRADVERKAVELGREYRWMREQGLLK